MVGGKRYGRSIDVSLSKNGGSQSEWECSEEIMICEKVGMKDCRYDTL